MTTNINLLPWREEKRERNKRIFFSGLGISAALALIVVIATFIVLNGWIDAQIGRNKLIENEIARYDRKIAKIKEIKLLKDALVSRMTVIQQLQESRPEIVHFFDELVKVMPQAIYILKVERIGDTLMLTGHTDSNSSVSGLMHTLRHNPWINNPQLEEVEEVTNKNRTKLFNQFRLKVTLKPINKVDEGELDE